MFGIPAPSVFSPCFWRCSGRNVDASGALSRSADAACGHCKLQAACNDFSVTSSVLCAVPASLAIGELILARGGHTAAPLGRMGLFLIASNASGARRDTRTWKLGTPALKREGISVGLLFKAFTFETVSEPFVSPMGDHIGMEPHCQQCCREPLPLCPKCDSREESAITLGRRLGGRWKV